MNLVDDIDLMFSHHRGKTCPVNQVTDILDMGFIRRIDFNNVWMVSFDRRPAVFTFITWGMVRIRTVDRPRKQSCHGGFSGSAGTAEKIGMTYLVFGHRIADRPYDIFLTDQFVKRLGPVFLIQRYTAHKVHSLPHLIIYKKCRSAQGYRFPVGQAW